MDFTDFRRSDNIDDRRDESLWSKYSPSNLLNAIGLAPGDIASMASHPFTPYRPDDLPAVPWSQLGSQLGLDSIPEIRGAKTSSAGAPYSFMPPQQPPIFASSIISAESGGDPNATNPNSSATGAGQFIASTWLDTLAKHRPDLTGSPDELLAMRNDPKLSAEMTAAYAGDNQAILSKAGHPVTPGNTYLAHFAGPQGAVSVLSADPSTPVSQVLTPAAVKANPFLQGMTAGDLRAWADRKMGGSQAPPASPAAPANAPLNLAPQAPPIFAAQPAPQQPQQQAQEAQAAPFEMPAPMQAAPIFASPRARVDLTKLRAAFPQRPVFTKG